MENRVWNPNDNVIPVSKPVGMTPLQALERLRAQHPALQGKLAYAGRLDPMAEGLLIVLVGEECKKREEYQMLSKVYEVTVLFGFSTDTYDAMGIVTEHSSRDELTTYNIERLENILPNFIGSSEQAYPPYSSARVHGKPLFYWARNELLNSITIPKKSIQIKSIELLENGSFSNEDLLSTIQNKIKKVDGDFRQSEILAQWDNILSKSPQNLPYATIRVACTQGAYMRSLATDIGIKVGVPSLSLSIKRIAVGDFRLEDALTIPSQDGS